MKLNASKCSFKVSSGKFLGFLVNYRGLEANPEKTEAFKNTRAPTSIKEIQKLTRMIITLNKFISRCSNRCHSFFKALKEANN